MTVEKIVDGQELYSRFDILLVIHSTRCLCESLISRPNDHSISALTPIYNVWNRYLEDNLSKPIKSGFKNDACKIQILNLSK